MPKQKTNRAAAKRVKVTGTGKIKIQKSRLRHNLENKSSDTKRQYGKAAYVHESDVGRVKRLVPYLF